MFAIGAWTATTILSFTPFTGAKADDTDTFYGEYAGAGVTGSDDSAFGYEALTGGGDTSYDVGIGSGAMPYDFLGATYHRTAVGDSASAMGDDNTSIGVAAGSSEFCSLGDPCFGPVETTGVGRYALFINLGPYNTGTGYRAADDFGNYHDYGEMDTANGYMALHRTPGGLAAYYFEADNSTATGALTLNSDLNYARTLTNDNTANGAGALQNCISSENTATGVGAINGADGVYSQTGTNNTAEGWNALLDDVEGSSNLAGGYLALSRDTGGNNNTGLGNNALLANTTGGTNIGLGDAAGSLLTTGSNSIDIGSPGVAGESNTIRIGIRSQTVTNITGIRGTTVSGGIAVMIDANGRLGTTTSSAHFKEKIKAMAKNSEAIYSLQPVTFRYKKAFDPTGTPQFGLVAEDVAKVDPDLVACDEQGKPYMVRYDAINAMLLNEFLKQQRKVEDQARLNQKQVVINQQLQSILTRQNAELDDLVDQLSN